MVLIVVTTVCAVIVRALVAGGEIRSIAALLFVAGGVLALAIVTLLKFLGVLNRTRRAMLPT